MTDETAVVPGFNWGRRREDHLSPHVGGGHVPSSPPARRAWLIRTNNIVGASLDMVGEWLAEGYCSLSLALPDLPSRTSKLEIDAAVKAQYPDMPLTTRGIVVGDVDRFITEISQGDLAIAVEGADVFVGVITSGVTYHPTTPATYRRSVRWVNRDGPFQRGQLSPDAADSLRGQITVCEVTPYLAEFARLGGAVLDPIEVAVVSSGEVTACVAKPTPALADALLLDLAWLQETVELLNDKRQLILYGPPGTGKTYLAQELCRALVEAAGGEYAIVQFHPSYAYEDFFEGLRPRLSAAGAVGFELVPGPLRRMAALAERSPAKPYVLIIDEINRANLAKVFGELYFLLEYRGQNVTLQYSATEFRLPRNLFLIGTMNTADRSVALVDAAMRRRFYFQGMFPTASPIREMLGRWLARQGLSAEPAHLLDELNARIADEDFAVGPSYLMTRAVAAPGGLERLWKVAILPLLAEHYFGEGRDVAREFGLPSLRAALDDRVPVGLVAPPLSSANTEGTAADGDAPLSP